MSIKLKPGYLILGSALTVFAESAAFAYMGAGAGLTAIGSALSFLLVMALMVFGFVWYPLRRLFRKAFKKTEGAEKSDE